MSSSTPFAEGVARVRAGADPTDEASIILQLLTPPERLQLLDGDAPFWQGLGDMLGTGYNTEPISMGRIDRVGLPGIQFADGPRGVVVGHATAFPVPSARAAAFDATLEEAVGEVIGREARALGANYFGGVCINLPRNPAWGRSQESFGEEPALLGELGAALVRGTRPHVMPCAKHFALNSMENARFTVDVQVSEADLHEYYLPHFKRAVEAGADSIMSAYNSVNGEWAGQNSYLLTTVLREDWGFSGFVLSDFIWGHRDVGRGLRAGLDVEAPFAQQRAAWLPGAIERGETSWDDVDRAGTRIIAAQLGLYARRNADAPDDDEVAGPGHRQLAREVAVRSMVMLRNEEVAGAPVLPLAPGSSLAVLGRLATMANTGDHGSSDVRPPSVVTAAEGLRAAHGDAVQSDDSGDPRRSAMLAATADVAVVVVGYTAAEEGEYLGGEMFEMDSLNALYPPPLTDADREIGRAMRESAAGGTSMAGTDTAGGDRRDLRLPRADVELIEAVAAANPRTVVVVVTGASVIVEEWLEQVPAVLVSGYSGMEGGHALADVLGGARDATGRLPYAIPVSADHLAPMDPGATSITYDGSFGQRRLDAAGTPARFPFGFGLSYATTDVGVDGVARQGDLVTLDVTVHNRSDRPTHRVVQIYARRDDGQRFLVGFGSVPVPAHTRAQAQVVGRLAYVGRWDPGVRDVVPPAAAVDIEVAGYWGDPDAITVTAPARP